MIVVEGLQQVKRTKAFDMPGVDRKVRFKSHAIPNNMATITGKRDM